MFKLGKSMQDDGFLELRKGKVGSYFLSVGDCFDDGEEDVCMPLFSFTKPLSRERVEALIRYLQDNI